MYYQIGINQIKDFNFGKWTYSINIEQFSIIFEMVILENNCYKTPPKFLNSFPQ